MRGGRDDDDRSAHAALLEELTDVGDLLFRRAGRSFEQDPIAGDAALDQSFAHQFTFGPGAQIGAPSCCDHQVWMNQAEQPRGFEYAERRSPGELIGCELSGGIVRRIHFRRQRAPWLPRASEAAAMVPCCCWRRRISAWATAGRLSSMYSPNSVVSQTRAHGRAIVPAFSRTTPIPNPTIKNVIDPGINIRLTIVATDVHREPLLHQEIRDYVRRRGEIHRYNS